MPRPDSNHRVVKEFGGNAFLAIVILTLLEVQMLSTSLGRLRVVGSIEGISYLLLLFIAMPLKYLAGMPLAVKYVGWIHGVLFMAYVAAMLLAAGDREWGIWKIARAFVAAVVPFGTFYTDREWREEDEASRTIPSPVRAT
jgi:integral membrane protein